MVTLPHTPSPILCRIELFGGLRIVTTDTVVDRFPTQKIAGLLALLAFYPEKTHTREQLIDQLWPDAELDAGRDRLSQALVWLRPRLEPKPARRGAVLTADRTRVSLTNAVATDVADYESLLLQSRSTTSQQQRIQALTAAVQRYRGELLPGNYSEWVLTERRRLQASYLLALRALVQHYETEGDFAAALNFAHQALVVDPLQEEAHQDVIRLLALNGKSSLALAQYEEMCRILQQELEAQPVRESVELAQRIRNGAFTNPQITTNVSHGGGPLLPRPLTRLFGRDDDIRRVETMVATETQCLVTLFGPGGSGKTRLALACAHLLENRLPGITAFVPLADIEDPTNIAATIVTALGLPRLHGVAPIEQIVQKLSVAPSLLVLDNAEHLVDGVADIAQQLLSNVEGLRLIVTSRQRLGLTGEQLVSVLPLQLPPDPASSAQLRQSPCVQLFADRAQSVRPSFIVSHDNEEAIRQLCIRLDGIPLAIELCAAWSQTLSPSQMLEMFDRKYDLLVSRNRDTDPRHRSMRTAIEYSVSQLPAHLKTLFARLSVFRGGCDIGAVEAVCADDGALCGMALLDALSELRERSLLFADEVTDRTGQTHMRYRMLDTLRDYASRMLNGTQLGALRKRHARHFLQMAIAVDRGCSGSEQELWLARVDQDQENMRNAMRWCIEYPDSEMGLHLGVALLSYWTLRGYLQEGFDWLTRLLKLPMQLDQPQAATIRARALATCGYLAWLQGDYQTAGSLHQEALSLYQKHDNLKDRADVLYYLGINAYRLEQGQQASEYFAQSMELSQQLGDQAGIARILLNQGNLLYERKLYGQARVLMRQSLEIEQALGNKQRIANVYNNLGLLSFEEQDYAEAEHLYRKALAIRRELTDNYGTTIALLNLAECVRMTGNHSESAHLLLEGVDLAHSIGSKHILAFYFMHLALLSDTAPDRCVYLITAAQELMTRLGGAFNTPHLLDMEQALQRAKLALPPERYAERRRDGAEATIGQVVTECLHRR